MEFEGSLFLVDDKKLLLEVLLVNVSFLIWAKRLLWLEGAQDRENSYG